MRVWWPALEQKWRLAAIALIGSYFCFLYWGAALLVWRAPRILSPSALDATVPFLSDTVWIYLSELLLVSVAIWVADPIGRSRFVLATMAAIAVASLVFTLFPTTVPRASPDLKGITGLAWRLLYSLDTPINALPSLHAAIAVPAAAALWRCGSRWRALGAIWSGAVLLAALTTKQHLVADLTAGIVLGALAQALSLALVIDRSHATARRKARTSPPHAERGAP